MLPKARRFYKKHVTHAVCKKPLVCSKAFDSATSQPFVHFFAAGNGPARSCMKRQKGYIAFIPCISSFVRGTQRIYVYVFVVVCLLTQHGGQVLATNTKWKGFGQNKNHQVWFVFCFFCIMFHFWENTVKHEFWMPYFHRRFPTSNLKFFKWFRPNCSKTNMGPRSRVPV